MSEISIDSALEHIESSKQRERREGLSDLEHILKQNRRSQKLQNVSDRGYHAIFEVLFRLVHSEKATFSRSAKSGKTQAFQMLSTCARVIRLAVEVGLKHLRQKTLRAIVDHIVDSLPEPSGQYSEPLELDYLRALRAILEYQPHPAHFSKQQWFRLVEFCNEGLQIHVRSDDESSSAGLTVSIRSERNTDQTSRSTTPLSLNGSFTPIRKSTPNVKQVNTSPRARHVADSLVACLYRLFLVAHARILDIASDSLGVLLEFLRSVPPLKRPQGQEHAFGCLNAILSNSSTENLLLATATLKGCLPQIRRLWQLKTQPDLKNEMLITLILGEPLLGRLPDEDDWEDVRIEIEALMDVLQAEYSKRSEKEVLQLDDLEFGIGISADRNDFMTNQAFQLKSGAVRSEQAWALLRSVSKLFTLLNGLKMSDSKSLSSNVRDNNELPRKRQKVAQPLHEILHKIWSSPSPEKMVHLQILAFVLEDVSLDADSIQNIFEHVMPLISSEMSSIADWAMLLISSAACSNRTYEASKKSDEWLQIWRLTSRKVTNQWSCRSACHLMKVLLQQDLVEYSDISDIVDSMLSSSEINGPVSFSDCSSKLWTCLIPLRGRHSPSLIYETSERLIRWLFIRWRPSQIEARGSDTQSTHDFGSRCVLDLVSSILGLHWDVPTEPVNQGFGAVALAGQRVMHNRGLGEFLLLRDSKSWHESPAEKSESLRLHITLSDSRFQKLCTLFIDSLDEQINSLLKQISSNQSTLRTVTADAVGSIATLCILSFALIATPRLRRSPRLQSLQNNTEQLRKLLRRLILLHSNPELVCNGLLDIGSLLGFKKEPLGNGDSKAPSHAAHVMSKDFGVDFWSKFRELEHELREDEDLMDIDDDLDSQHKARQNDAVDEMPRNWLGSLFDIRSRRASHLLRICLASFQDAATLSNKGREPEIPLKFVEYLLQERPQKFFTFRRFLDDLLAHNESISVVAGVKIMEYLGQDIIQLYEFERCEVAMGTCVDILRNLSPSWTTTDDDMAELSSQLYQWFIEIVLDRQIASPHVHTCIANMLQSIIQFRPDYGSALSLPSARTSLFRILEEGYLVVKFEIGLKISNVFRLFVLKEHDAILDDVLDHLPIELDWMEATALRMFVLAHLGSSWPTLIRRCIYALVEACGLVPQSISYAQYCIGRLANTLGLKDSKDLFKLFASQIIYTWLETQSLESLPFGIFGYEDLKELIWDVESEVTAQVVMRGRNSEVQQLSKSLSEAHSVLLRRSFGKSLAYVVARDAAVPPEVDPDASGGAARLRNAVGKETYASLISEKFPEIIATLFKVMEREDSVMKGFQRDKTYTSAEAAYKEILQLGDSSNTLAISQQPSFKAACLIDEIEYVCSRSPYDKQNIWTPALYIFVFRELVSTICPALGSLHTAAIMRKIRVLVAMAGQTALESYPLEMALHAMRPLLTNSYCAEDAIGTCQYLYMNGSAYLLQTPTFLTGLAISTIISLRSFLDSSQESTTQESQHRKTISKAKEFHAWIGNLIGEFPIADTDDGKMNTKRLVKLSMQLHVPGNAVRGTPESELLAALLADQVTGDNLVEESYRNAILGMLCANFEVPSNPSEDIMGNDEEAVQNASVAWKSQSQKQGGLGYSLWIARVLGRAYAASGFVDPEIIREINLGSKSSHRLDTFRFHVSGSRFAIIDRLRKMLLSDCIQDVGLAERALQAIAMKTESDETLIECIDQLPQTILPSLAWKPYSPPSISCRAKEVHRLSEAFHADTTTSLQHWSQRTCLALLELSRDGTLLELRQILQRVDSLSESLFQYVLHIALLGEREGRQMIKETISRSIIEIFKSLSEGASPVALQIIKTILYLRSQPLPRETTKADRSYWLDIDYRLAAEVAAKCNMLKTALLFLEINVSESKGKGSRRSSVAKHDVPKELLLHIFRNLEDKDFFYGIQQAPGLAAMMGQLEFENAGFKSLSFRGAHYDSQIQQNGLVDRDDEEGLIHILESLDLNGLSQSMLSAATSAGHVSTEAMFQTARKLERWDLSTPDAPPTKSTTIFRVFQNVHDASLGQDIRAALDAGFSSTIGLLKDGSAAASTVHSTLSTLAILTEIEDVLAAESIDKLRMVWDNMHSHDEWMLAESFDHIRDILSCRKTLFSTISKSENLRALLNVSHIQARTIEVNALLASSTLARRHGALQSCLDTATFLERLVSPCAEVGLSIDVAVQFEASSVLWEQGEMASSIRLLQDILAHSDLRSQSVRVGRPELLAKLGHRISEARLEKPDQILSKYLVPAIKELRGLHKGAEAGQVFHEFAAFCDKQLQNPDIIEDMRRMEDLRDRKEAEVRDLDDIIAGTNSKSKERDTLKVLRSKAKQWFELDDREFQRLRDSRLALLKQSLENYLLCLDACDVYENDALRFSALWLEHSDIDAANESVSKHLDNVPSRKFAPLMNQWTSRLLDTPSRFQTLLSSLVLRICEEHPYHGMYHIFASSNSKGGKDQKSLSRNAAAKAVVAQLREGRYTANTWIAIHNTNVNFVRFAAEKPEDGTMKLGSRNVLRNTKYGSKLEHDAETFKVPPPSMKIELRADRNYAEVPYVVKYQSDFTIASGVSAPKILTAITSNGRKYKQLLKSGNDDMRQDAIMEQVFEQVSNLLKTQRETRQRNLGIRTYKVLPLTATVGIIEFVQNTVPLHDYLLPAHKKHYPNDLKPTACREAIQRVQSNPNDTRIKVFRQVCEKFNPVLRYFFMERFENPDEWFIRRLAYTRSTATISILGHVLGLGDRHGHNILLDESTGEVVHIDLGIAFEQGRILPVPELVPFRLTRDIVDGMGITKTEGVFRRCCEFTLDALRKESYSIMTILDVLRYDPLYSWSLSPTQLRKWGDDRTEAPTDIGKPRGHNVAGVDKKDEEGEADRALKVVSKKLSKTLSVTATVNELIQQATDEKNLALLFCGWAAYA